MNNIFNKLEKQISIINILSEYYIEFGILVEDEFKTVEVNILNTDDTITKIEMPIGEVMYLTEYGTLTIPARPILNLALKWVNSELDKLIDKIFNGVFKYNWNEYNIETEMQRFSNEMELYVRSQISKIVISNSTLASLINIKDENKYLYDLNKLKYYIKFKIFKKN